MRARSEMQTGTQGDCNTKEGIAMIEYEAKMEPRKVRRRHLNPKIKKALTPSVETQEHVEWAVAGVVMVLGTVVAVEVMAAFAAILM